eukprot:TRINITY_DN2456_c3_g1_i1.p1 TRINITY_DN2456_c3_g1~~TRINITY_DN2456_c3_g1_i1.p1  ORF type:complete len:115 (+),score=1.15 TRINITY_DN2456_c3_g1_i1:179-523(+)
MSVSFMFSATPLLFSQIFFLCITYYYFVLLLPRGVAIHSKKAKQNIKISEKEMTNNLNLPFYTLFLTSSFLTWPSFILFNFVFFVCVCNSKTSKFQISSFCHHPPTLSPFFFCD